MDRLLMEKFNLNKLSEVEGKERYLVEFPNRFTAVEYLDAEVGINKAWGCIESSSNASLGFYELKYHEPLQEEECL
jgi:hypothetical protein